MAQRLHLERGDVLDLGDQRNGSYDLVSCHRGAMYLPSLAELTIALVGAARPGQRAVVTRGVEPDSRSSENKSARASDTRSRIVQRDGVTVDAQVLVFVIMLVAAQGPPYQ